jgi:hypothetical protein
VFLNTASFLDQLTVGCAEGKYSCLFVCLFIYLFVCSLFNGAFSVTETI